MVLPNPQNLDHHSPTFQWEAIRFLQEVSTEWESSLQDSWENRKERWTDFTRELAIKIAESGQWNLQVGGDRILVDFPSTGGVGNKTPLIAPFLALQSISNICIPKVSTRGETGGTIDILEAVGTRVSLGLEEFQRQLKKCSIAFAVAQEGLAPLDEALMKVRKMTYTMRCTPLVVASILGKKLAVGCKHLVVDVKFGPDAKFRNLEDLRRAIELFQEVWTRVQPEGKIECVVSNNYVPQGFCFGRLLSLW